MGPSDQPPQSSRLHEGLCPPSSPITANCLHNIRGTHGDTRVERKEEEINFHCGSRHSQFLRPCYGSIIKKNLTVINLTEGRPEEGQIKMWEGDRRLGTRHPFTVQAVRWLSLTRVTLVHMTNSRFRFMAQGRQNTSSEEDRTLLVLTVFTFPKFKKVKQPDWQ